MGFNMTIAIFSFMAITCVVQLFLDMNDTLFFILIMIMVLTSAAATCLAQNGTMAIVNVMGEIYANAVMVGQAVAGVLPSCALIISILLVGQLIQRGKGRQRLWSFRLLYYCKLGMYNIYWIVILD